MNEEQVICPKCGNTMGKGGLVNSGDHKVQRYTCNHCGKTTTKTNHANNIDCYHSKTVIIDFTDLEYAQINLRCLKAGFTSIPTYIKSIIFREH